MTEGLGRRIALTLGALLLYRLGTYIPLPGIDPTVWDQVFQSQRGGILGSLDLLSGGGIHRLAIFALGIMPYVSAAIILQLAMIVSRRLRGLAREGERGRAVIERRTRYLAVALALIQAYGVAVGLEGVPGLVGYPGSLFILSTVVTLAGGTLFLIWLSSQITLRGIGNGVAVLLFVGLVTQLPATIAQTLELGRQGLLPSNALPALVLIVVAVTGFIVVMERARRRIPIQYAPRQGAEHVPQGQSDLSVKLNAAGVIPVTLASLVLTLTVVGANILGGQTPAWLGSGRPFYLILYAALIILFAFLYTAFVLDPEAAAESLKQLGGTIPGVEPGEATAAHLDQAISRTTLIGSAYLALVCLLPQIVIHVAAVPFYFGGPPLLIVVCTAVDLMAQVQGVRRDARIGRMG
jgi:preprotein translocase subunit SecY